MPNEELTEPLGVLLIDAHRDEMFDRREVVGRRHTKDQFPKYSIEGFDKIHEQQENAQTGHVSEINRRFNQAVRKIRSPASGGPVL